MSIVSVEPVNASDVGAMLQAMQSYGMLPRDAIHLAVARRLGITAIVSDDDVFDQIPGIRLYKP
jgi:predicted nucleic acid-binding protein